MNTETKVILGIGILTLVVLGGIMFFASGQTTQPLIESKDTKKGELVRPDSNEIKAEGAKVTLVEFGDYQCPACGQVEPIIKKINDDYKGKVNFVFRNFPLSMHPNAQPAARVAEAAGLQGKFWEMHDKIYENQDSWSTALSPAKVFANYASELGLNVDKLKEDSNSQKVTDKIAEDMGDGNALKIDATPTFYINGTKLKVAPTYENLKLTLDKALAEAK